MPPGQITMILGTDVCAPCGHWFRLGGPAGCQCTCAANKGMCAQRPPMCVAYLVSGARPSILVICTKGLAVNIEYGSASMVDSIYSPLLHLTPKVETPTLGERADLKPPCARRHVKNWCNRALEQSWQIRCTQEVDRTGHHTQARVSTSLVPRALLAPTNFCSKCPCGACEYQRRKAQHDHNQHKLGKIDVDCGSRAHANESCTPVISLCSQPLAAGWFAHTLRQLVETRSPTQGGSATTQRAMTT